MIRKTIGGLKRWLNRYTYFQLEPDENITRKPGSEYDWGAESADPMFHLKPAKSLMPWGWYMVEIKIRADIHQLSAKFYFDYGADFEEKETFQLPVVSGRTVKRLVYLPHLPQELSFVPSEKSCNFSIKHLRFCKVAGFYARKLMLKKLCNVHPQYTGKAYQTIYNEITIASRKQTIRRYGEKKEILNHLIQTYDECFQPNTHTSDYQTWIKRYETAQFDNPQKLLSQINRFTCRPLISIVLPTYNSDKIHLRACIDSVTTQIYDNWELCIADDASTDPEVKKILEKFTQNDRRIKLTFRKTNGHISEASNSALKLVAGEYVALLDHDDMLAPHALFEVVKEINNCPGVDILYSDEDKIDTKGNRFEPHFKPDWNPDLLLSQNYISHLGVYKTSLIKSINGFRKGFEGAQDYDLLLRCVAKTASEKIRHIPQVLYHWRATSDSTAFNSNTKPYTTAAGIRAVQDYLGRQNKTVHVKKGLTENTFKVTYVPSKALPQVSLLIPTRNGHEILKKCVESILKKTTYENYEIIILDNQSDDSQTLAYLESVKKYPKIRMLAYNHPFNYSAINNFGVKHARGSIIGLINNDIEVISPGWLTEMVSHAVRREIGCVGAKLYYSNDTIQHGGVVLGIGGVAGHAHKYFPREDFGYFSRLLVTQNYSAVTGACLLVRKEIYLKVGGLDEKLAIAFNDVDFCMRVRQAGHRNLWTPFAELYHHESISRGHEDTPEKQARFQQEINFMKSRWAGLLDSDPCYNPNLTLTREDFSLRNLQ